MNQNTERLLPSVMEHIRYTMYTGHSSLSSGPVLRRLTESSITTTEINYFPISQNTVNKTDSDFFQRCLCLYTYAHIF